MNPRPLPERLRAAVYDLATVKPHERTTHNFTPAEWAAYCDGYYTALAFALRVMDMADETQLEPPAPRRGESLLKETA